MNGNGNGQWLKVAITTLLAVVMGMVGFFGIDVTNKISRIQERHEALSASVAHMDARYHDLAGRFNRGSQLLETLNQQVYDMHLQTRGCIKLCREARPDLE